MKKYTKKQITEAIAYWKKQLAKGNYRKVNESGDELSDKEVKNDGWFMKDPSNEKDIYAISKKDFDSTYKKQG